MGYELDKVKKIRIVNKETGEEVYSQEIGDWDTSMPYTVEDQTAEESKIAFPKNSEFNFSTTWIAPPKPNVMFIISEAPNRTLLHFYRPKKFNRFQVWMYKFSFGIKIIQGRNEIHEYLSKIYGTP
jgi:hypothetical protein